MNRIHALLLTLSLTLPCFAPGCSRAGVTEEVTSSHGLAPDGRVSVENVNGGITITTWDRAEVEVHALKKAPNAELLEKIEIIITSDEDFLKLETRLPTVNRWLFGGSTQKGEVSYDIKVPRQAQLQNIASVNGRVTIRGVAGKVKASTVNGSLEAEGLERCADLTTVNGRVQAGFASVAAAEEIRLKTVNGKIELTLPAAATGQFKASTVNGSIETDFELTVKKLSSRKALEASLGEGGPRMTLNTVNGGIAIRRGK